MLNKICGISEQILKTEIFVISFMKRNIKLRQKKLLTIINVLKKKEFECPKKIKKSLAREVRQKSDISKRRSKG